MIESVVRWAVRNRVLVLLGAVGLIVAGAYSVSQTPVDALPDLSDVQVIVKTAYPGQAPRVVEDQVTYPLATALLAVPGAVSVRGYSFFGDSFVYVIFDDQTDLYWARSRVLEYLSQTASQLPQGVAPALGPDASGVGWIYEYVLVDRTGGQDLAQLRALQDWFLRFELQTVPGVAEVATVGGMVRQYQVVVDPDRLSAFGLSLADLRRAIERGNREAGASVVEMAEAEYMVRLTGYLRGLDDLAAIPLGADQDGVPTLLGDVAELRVGPAMRRGVAELDGEGEVVGGIVVMRSGANALATIDRVKERLDGLKQGLPAGVEIVPVYDRSALIERARGDPRHHPCGGACRRRPGVRALPVPPALVAGGGAEPAGGHSRRLRLDAAAGHQRQHHVLGRHRHRHRRDGGRRHRDGGERPPPPRGCGERRRGADWRSALAGARRCRRRSRRAALLLAAGDHAQLPAGVLLGSPRRPPVRAARLHQDLRDGRRGDSRGDAGAGADGLLHPGPGVVRQEPHGAHSPPPPTTRCSRRCCAGPGGLSPALWRCWLRRSGRRRSLAPSSCRRSTRAI